MKLRLSLYLTQTYHQHKGDQHGGVDVMLHASLIPEEDKTEWPASHCEWYVPKEVCLGMRHQDF